MGYSWIATFPVTSQWNIPFDYLTVRHGIAMAHRNRWFTELKTVGSFHGELLVITRWYSGGSYVFFKWYPGFFKKFDHEMS